MVMLCTQKRQPKDRKEEMIISTPISMEAYVYYTSIHRIVRYVILQYYTSCSVNWTGQCITRYSIPCQCFICSCHTNHVRISGMCC
jgi:hypothetical protein